MTDQRGLLKTVILIIIAIAVLAYFGISALDIVASDIFQTVWAFSISLWNSHISPIISYLWSTVILQFITGGLGEFFQGIGGETIEPLENKIPIE